MVKKLGSYCRLKRGRRLDSRPEDLKTCRCFKAAQDKGWARLASLRIRACSHYAEGFNDEREAEESEKDDVEFFKAREDAAEAFEPAE